MAGQINVDCRMGAYYDACCELFADPFTRGDSATVGNGWDESSDPDVWSIVSGVLQATDSGVGGTYSCVHEIDAGPPEHSVEADVRSSAGGMMAGVLARFNGDNRVCFLSLELEWVDDECAILRLKNTTVCEGGDPEGQILGRAAVLGADLDAWHSLKICYRGYGDQDQAQVYGRLRTSGGARIVLAGNTTLPTTDPDFYNYAGVIAAVGDDATVDFDNFVVEALDSQDGQSECCAYCYYDKPYDCVLVTDDFGRACVDQEPIIGCANLGCLWSDCENGRIEDGEAIFETSNTHCAIDYLLSIPAWAVLVSVLGADDADELDVLIAYEDADNYLFARLTVGDSCGSLELFQRAGGTNTQLGETVAVATAYPDAWHTMRVCWDGTTLWAHVTTASAEDQWYSKAAQISGAITSLGGIGVGSITTMGKFDNFSIEYMKGVFEGQKYIDDCEDCKPADPTLGCIIHADAFNGSDSTDLGCYWEEVSGDHEVETLTLLTITPGIVISKIPNPYGSSSAYITVGISAPDDGDSARVICDYVDPDNYHFLQVNWGVTGTGNADGTFMLYKRTGGSDTALLDEAKVITGVNGGDSVAVTICFFEGYFEGMVSNGTTTFVDYALSTEHGGERAGLGGDSADVRFDNWSFEHLFGTEDTEDCGNCLTPVDGCIPCLHTEMPDQLKVSIPGVTFSTTGEGTPFPGIGCASPGEDGCPLEDETFPPTWILPQTESDTDCSWCVKTEIFTWDDLVACTGISIPSPPSGTDPYFRVTILATIDLTTGPSGGLTVTVYISDSPGSDDPDICGTSVGNGLGCLGIHRARYRRPWVTAEGGDEMGTYPNLPRDPEDDSGALCLEWSNLPLELDDVVQLDPGDSGCCDVNFPQFLYVSSI